MSDVNRKWVYLIVLSIIWGTSYILIKKGLEGFTPIQLGSVRIVITSVVLLTIG
ncbi:MAG: EamA family transporter, partial [Flavobacteriaceae bacterium]|nr:EamA family transporter [Flavobacteriaceae bacterium]